MRQKRGLQSLINVQSARGITSGWKPIFGPWSTFTCAEGGFGTSDRKDERVVPRGLANCQMGGATGLNEQKNASPRFVRILLGACSAELTVMTLAVHPG